MLGLLLLSVLLAPGAAAQGLLSFISERDGSRDVFLIGADGRGERRLTSGPGDENNGPVTPDGKHLLLTTGEGDAERGERRFRFFLQPLPEPQSAARAPEPLRPLLPPRAALLSPSFTPSGEHLLFEAESEGLRDVFRLSLRGRAAGAAQQLTHNREGNFHPAACPRGDWVVFTSSRDRVSELYRMRSDGSDVRRLTYSPGSEWQPRCAPDGSRIYFVSDRDGADRIYSVHINGSEPRRLTRRDLQVHVVEDAPALSPDGRYVAFVLRSPQQPARLHWVDLKTGAEAELPTPADRAAREPAWSPLRPGRPPQLAFTLSAVTNTAAARAATQIYVTDPERRAVEPVTTARGPNWHPLWIR